MPSAAFLVENVPERAMIEIQKVINGIETEGLASRSMTWVFTSPSLPKIINETCAQALKEDEG